MRWLKNKALILSVAVLTLTLYFPQSVAAERLINRSVKIGSSKPSEVTEHIFTFTVPTGGNIGSIEFEYCSNTPLLDTPCSTPAGLDVSSLSIDNQSGITGFSVHGSTTPNRLLLTRPSASVPAFQQASYDLGNITNPSTPDLPTYIRISTFASDDGSGPATDQGAVVFVLTREFTVEAFVPPFLTFCAGITVSSNCTTTEGNFINLGELSKTSANFSTSQFAGATNDPGGYSIFLAGTTLASGVNTIPALSSLGSSTPGTSQFGLNLVANSKPDVGQNRTGGGTATPVSDYGSPNKFKFNNEIVASTAHSTNFNVFTASYIINVSNDQKPGVYTTTVTYIATAAF